MHSCQRSKYPVKYNLTQAHIWGSGSISLPFIRRHPRLLPSPLGFIPRLPNDRLTLLRPRLERDVIQLWYTHEPIRERPLVICYIRDNRLASLLVDGSLEVDTPTGAVRAR